ncbi:hypothetical protein [Streptomyces subrutilus]|uniref:hypothetical protein n=1 Tax=Streptomyces subrutilus TaxID=36818 RepID=UPI002E0D92BD|nr:hypothetical protein OG479_21560 [Streptomyces subrutilus]
MSDQQPNPYASDPGRGGPQPGPAGPEDYRWGPGESGYGYPHAPGGAGYGYPHPHPAAPAHQPTLAGPGFSAPPYGPFPGGGGMLSLGDISVVGDQIVTPSGTMPLRGSIWNATDFSRTEEKIPTHAIVLAVVFAVFCLLGLLFLLMKEKVTTGYVQVTVSGGGRHHATMIPAVDAHTYAWVMSQVNQARALGF